MANSEAWLSLTDLGRIYGISAIHCGKTLKQQGWRDQHGRPTPNALQVGAAVSTGNQNDFGTALWNAKVCKALLEKTGYQPIRKSIQIKQWVQLLEALEEGSPSINTTAEQMAEELPRELVVDVNNQLAARGCSFRIKNNKKVYNYSA